MESVDTILAGMVERAVAAAVDARVAELKRPDYLTQRSVEQVCSMPAHDFLRHCREGHWPSWCDRRVRYAKTKDVIAWLESHPVKVRAANDADEEAKVFAKSRSGIRRIAT